MSKGPLVERVQLGPGLEISRVLTGLWQIADMERGGTEVDSGAGAKAMDSYVDAGLTTFDMADHYGSAEVIAGAFRARRPGDGQMLTKWVPTPGPASREDVVAAVERALSRLGGESIDLLQFHAWNYADPGWLDQLFWLTELRDEGKIKNLGMTNCDAAHLQMALETGIPIVSNQVCFSLLDRRPAEAMTDVCRRHGVKLLAYGTLAGGLLSDRWIDSPEPPIDDALTWSQMKYRRFVDEAGGWDRFQALLRTVKRVADRAGVSVANVACRYVMEQEAVGGIIVGARLGERSHLEETLKLFDFSLDAEAHQALSAAVDALDRVHGGCGDEYRRPPFLTAAGDLSHHVTEFPKPYPTKVVGGREYAFTGTIWEELAGFSRAVRVGNRISVSGTTATHRDKVIGGRDPAAQTHFILDKIEGALQSLGAEMKDVIRTRVYLRNEDDWEPVSRAHGRRFDGVWPANTLVQSTPIGDEYLVEIDAEAQVD
ncbi:MAG: aldo/keto reductase [Longimicrobiales bacterium]